MYIRVQHPELVLLDFDHTVFNTTAYVAAMQAVFEERFGIAPEEFMRQREAVKDCCVVVDIDTFVARLPHDDKEGMHRAMLEVIAERAADFTWPDARGFVVRHREQFDVVLLTHGDEELQAAKIRHSGLPVNVPYVVTEEAKSAVLAPYVDRYRRVHFIDDKPGNIEEVKGRWPGVEVYYMRRLGDRPYGGGEPQCACEHHEVAGLDFTIEPLSSS